MRSKTFIASRENTDHARKIIRLDYQDGAGTPSRRHKEWTPEEMFALSVRKALKGLARHRRAQGKSVGHLPAWITVAADISAALHGTVTDRTVEAICVSIGIDLRDGTQQIIAPIAARAAAARRAAGSQHFKMMDGEAVGLFVELTSDERTLLGIRNIGSIDENKDDRRKRLDRERQRRKREAGGATPRPQSAAQSKPWEDKGISRSTYHRRKAKWDENVTLSVYKGNVDETVSNSGKADEIVSLFADETVSPSVSMGKADEIVSKREGEV